MSNPLVAFYRSQAVYALREARASRSPEAREAARKAVRIYREVAVKFG